MAYLESNMFNPLTLKRMDEEEIKKLIARRELEIRQIQELSPLIGEKETERQIDIRLDFLSDLYKMLKKRN